jgi:hypothetical protein
MASRSGILSILVLAALACAPAAGAASPARPVIIPLTPYLGVVPSLQASVNGKPGTFLFDTAGGTTAIDPAFASASGCKPWGQVTGFRMRGDRMDLERCDDLKVEASGVRLTAPTAGVLDLRKLLPKDAPPLAGSLALDAFAGRAVTIELARNRLILETPASLKARVRAAVEVPVRFSRDAGGLSLTPLAAVQTPQGRLWMELDTGSDGGAVVDRHGAAALGLDPDSKRGQDLSMTLAGGVAVKTRALVGDLIIDGNIGGPVLKTWTVTLDLARQRLWIAPAG